MLTLVLATANPHKQEEMKHLLTTGPWQIRTPQDLGMQLEIEETGPTYATNAYLKAHAWAKATGLWALADDTGLEVEALKGEPGLYSARYGPPGSPLPTAALRRAYLLERLQGHPRPWRARFRCVLALVSPQGNVLFAEGVLPGEIIPEERGEHGFGYDPLFYLPEQGRTLAQLTLEEKNRVSHRARAVAALRPALETLAQRLEANRP